MEQEPKQRTLQQNKALHLLFNMLSDELNTAGLDMRKTLKASIDILWNGDTVKEYLWRPIQEAQLRKKSTTELTTRDIDKVFETLNRHLGERFQIHVDFPSISEVLDSLDNNEHKD